MAWHPDLSIHPEANRQMQRLNEAFETLSDAEKRAEYDRQRAAPEMEAPIDAASSGAGTAEAVPAGGPPVETTPPTPEPPPVSPERQRELRRQRTAWLQSQFKIVLLAIVYTLLLFIWTLYSGEFNWLTVLLLLIPIGAVLVNLLRGLRRPAR
jgi:hypothetical protein